jgi:hypothetical protein
LASARAFSSSSAGTGSSAIRRNSVVIVSTASSARVMSTPACEKSEPALHHARSCLDWCERHDLADWDLAFAYEALARASRLAGDDEAAERYVEQARAVEIAETDDRELVEADLATI